MWGPQDKFPTTTNSGREFLQKEKKILGRGNFAAYLGVNEISQAAPDCTDGVLQLRADELSANYRFPVLLMAQSIVKASMTYESSC